MLGTIFKWMDSKLSVAKAVRKYCHFLGPSSMLIQEIGLPFAHYYCCASPSSRCLRGFKLHDDDFLPTNIVHLASKRNIEIASPSSWNNFSEEFPFEERFLQCCYIDSSLLKERTMEMSVKNPFLLKRFEKVWRKDT